MSCRVRWMPALLLSLAACGGSGARPGLNLPSGCDKVDAQLAQFAQGGKEADVRRMAERQPRLLNTRQVERRLADTVRRLPADNLARPVFLRYRITRQGRAEQVTVAKPSGTAAFDTAVIWSMEIAEFDPARLNGCPVAVWVEQDFAPHVPRRRRPRADATGPGS